MTLLAAVVCNVLMIAMLLMFLAGAIVYAFSPHLGVDLLKRSGVLLLALLTMRLVFF